MRPPRRPSVGVGGIVVRRDRALLVRRGKHPLRGRWTIPGGTVELGETLEQALVREIQEETGLEVRPREVLAVVDLIERDGGEVRYHYVIVDYLCEYLSGTARAGSDAEQVAMVSRHDLEAYDLPARSHQVVCDGLRRAARLRRSRPGATLLK